MHSSLKAARSRADMTLSELAEKSGVAIDTISAIERGVRVPQARTLHKLAQALGVDPAALIRNEAKIAV
jgi:transcriptional regulator with XRE-family HTH domain